MTTYFIIGICVQLTILIERAIRFPEIYVENYNVLGFWVSCLGLSLINVLIWPISLVCEIIDVAYGI